MIKRIIILLFLFGIIGGSTWYLLRSNPAKSVEKLRTKIDKLINSSESSDWVSVTTKDEREGKDLSEKKTRFEIARKTSDAILEINPNSEFDLGIRGLIEEQAGNTLEALNWYGKISQLDNPSPGNEIRKANLLEKLGHFQQAKGIMSGVLDVYPFESNYGLGRLHLETFQGAEAFQAFSRAKQHVNTDDESRKVLEGIANSLNLLISSAMNQLTREEIDGTKKARIEKLEDSIRSFILERDKVLDQAIELFEKLRPQSRNQFVAIQIKKFELLNKKGDSSSLEFSREKLLESVSSDEENRYFPLYLLLGSIDLQLAYHKNSDIDKRKFLIIEAINHYNQVFAFDFDGKSLKVSDMADWDFSENLSQSQFESQNLSKICRFLLQYPEYWRILSTKNKSGEDDPLQIHKKIQHVLEANPSDENLVEFNSILAWASLKDNDLNSYQSYLEKVLRPDDKEDQSNIALKFSEGIAFFAPLKWDILLELVNKYSLSKVNSSTEEERQKALLQLKSIIGILNQARSSLINLGSDNAKNEGVSRITQKIRDCIVRTAKNGSEPAYYLYASKLMVSLVGPTEALEILQEGIKQFPDNPTLNYALGVLYLDLGRAHATNESFIYYKSAFIEFFRIFIMKPYNNEVLASVISLGSSLAHPKSFPDSDFNLSEIVQELFTGCPKSSADILANILHAFFAKDFQKAIDLLPDKEDAKEVRPFLNLIAGICYLERANQVVIKRMGENPVISTERFDSDDDVKNQFNDLYANARKEFETGEAIDNSYLPFQFELIKMNLNEVKDGQEVPLDILKKLKSFREKYSEVSQVHFLYFIALQKKRSSLIINNASLEDLSRSISKERTVLRKAISINPSFVDAYIALAETYVISWRLSQGKTLEKYRNVYSKLGTPEFEVAISVLESAPTVPKTLALIAQLYEASKKPEKALDYYKAQLQLQPIEANVTKVIQSYLSTGNFEDAREWLQNINPDAILGGNFTITRNTLLAYIGSVESESSAITDSRRNELEDKQIEQYRSIIHQAEKMGKETPLLVLNNLAYLLANKGKAEESLKLIEPVINRLRSSDNGKLAKPYKNIGDTYAWSLFKSGKKESALEIYKNLCTQETKLDIHLNFARVLLDLGQYKNALDQVAIILNSEKEEKRIIESKTRELQQQIELAIGK